MIELRKFTEDDFDDYYKLVGSENVMKMITGGSLSSEAAKNKFGDMLENNALHPLFGRYKIVASSANEYIGLGRLSLEAKGSDSVELGYVLLEKFWGKGFGNIIAKQLIEIAKQEPQIKKITAVVDPDNIASRKILINNGFRSLGAERERTIPKEDFILDI